MGTSVQRKVWDPIGDGSEEISGLVLVADEVVP